MVALITPDPSETLTHLNACTASRRLASRVVAKVADREPQVPDLEIRFLPFAILAANRNLLVEELLPHPILRRVRKREGEAKRAKGSLLVKRLGVREEDVHCNRLGPRKLLVRDQLQLERQGSSGPLASLEPFCERVGDLPQLQRASS